MQKENSVSLWLGNIKLSKDLNKYLKVKYSVDGDLIPSDFAKDFKIRRYDDDFREAEFYEEPSNNIYELLEGFSYDNVIIDYFKSILKETLSESYNTVILLYNFEYDSSVIEINNSSGYFKYIGSTKYRGI